MEKPKPKIPPALVRRIILERDLTDTRVLPCTLPSGELVEFTIKSLSTEEKAAIRSNYDAEFPTPPVVSGRLGGAHFDLEDDAYQEALQQWNRKLQRAVLASTLGLGEVDITAIEEGFPRAFVNELFATAELLNGIQSDPLIDLVREAMWAPEVLTWLDTLNAKDPGFTISDTPLFREMEAMMTAGLSLAEWEKLSPRHKIMYLNFHTYKAARESYVAEKMEEKVKNAANGGIRRI